jgi:LysM repeat protein
VIILYSQSVTTYIVRPGDNIYKLVAQFHSSEYAILSANPGINPYNLLVGQVISIPIENGDPPAAQRNTGTTRISTSEMNLRNTLRKLWMEHVGWTRMTIISAVYDLPDLNLVSARLLRNATDMASALRPLYGDAAASQFGSLINEHLMIASQLVKAAKDGNTAAAQNAERAWYANADKIAGFLNSINPYISKEDFRKMLYNHLAMTKAEAVARLAHDYANDIALYDSIELQALMMADVMASGIVKQFPSTFA